MEKEKGRGRFFLRLSLSVFSHLEGLGGAKLLAGGHEAGHLGLSQLDLQATKIGLGDVLDLVL